MDENNFGRGYGNYFKGAILRALDISCLQSSQQLRGELTTAFERHLQLTVLWTWINIRANSFFGKFHEMTMGEGAIEIISSTKMQTCSSKKIEPRHFTYYCTLLFLSNKPSFQIQPSVDQIIFTAICLPFYFLILCVSWS